MQNVTQRFSDRVENYVRYRPTYPAQVLDLLREECDLTAQSVVADIGSGTGIFARMLLESGCRVLAVEPNAPMRGAAEKLLSGYADFTSIAAPAESTTLPDFCADFVTAAQAFHWFDRAKAKVEFRRVLKPQGFVILLWNERLADTTPFLRDYEKLLLDFSTDYAQVNHTQIDDAVLADFFAPHGFQKRSFANCQLFDYQGLEGRLLSSSYAPESNHPSHAPMLAQLRRLFDANAENGCVSFDYETNIYWGRL